jgi:hypothetical protein
MSAPHPAITAEVMREIAAGSGLSCSQAARLFPSYRRKAADTPNQTLEDRSPAPCNPSTVFRWITVGVVLDDDTRVFLEGAKLVGRWLTTPPAIERFLMAQQPRAAAREIPRTEGERSRGAKRADAELQELGI